MKSQTASAILRLWLACAVCVSPCLAEIVVSKKDVASAEKIYLQAAKDFRESHFDDARREFKQAADLNPQKQEYALALSVANQHAVTQRIQQAAEQRRTGHADRADELLAQARAIDPTDPTLLQHVQAAQPKKSLPVTQTAVEGTVVLQHSKDLHDFHLHEDMYALLRDVNSAYGVKTVIQNLHTRPQPLRLDVDGVNYEQAQKIVGELTGTFTVPLDEHTVFLTEDNEENRKNYERMVEETIALPGLTDQELQQVGSVVRSIFDITQTATQQGLNTLVVRAPAHTIDALNRTLDDLIDGDSEVMLHLQLYEVNHNRTRNTGLTPLQSLNLFSLAGEAQSLISQNASTIQQLIASGVIPSTATPAQIALALIGAGVANSSLITGAFLKIGGGVSTAILSAGNAPTLQLALSVSDARTLDDIQLRVANRQTTTFHAGTRYPVITSVFSNIATTSTNSALSNLSVNGVPVSSLLQQFLGGANSATNIPQFQYEDLGFTMKATVLVQRNMDIATHLELKVQALAGQGLNNIPILDNRSFTSDLTIPAGASAVIANVVSHDESTAISGLPGLSELPGFQGLTSKTSTNDSTDLIMLLTPVVTRTGHLKLTGPYIPVENTHSD